MSSTNTPTTLFFSAHLRRRDRNRPFSLSTSCCFRNFEVTSLLRFPSTFFSWFTLQNLFKKPGEKKKTKWPLFSSGQVKSVWTDVILDKCAWVWRWSVSVNVDKHQLKELKDGLRHWRWNPPEAPSSVPFSSSQSVQQMGHIQCHLNSV